MCTCALPLTLGAVCRHIHGVEAGIGFLLSHRLLDCKWVKAGGMIV